MLRAGCQHRRRNFRSRWGAIAFVASLLATSGASATATAVVERAPKTALERIEASLPAAKEIRKSGVRTDMGQVALVDLMLHAPLTMRFAIEAPKTPYDEVRLAPLEVKTRASTQLLRRLSSSHERTLAMRPETKALSVRLRQPSAVATPAISQAGASIALARAAAPGLAAVKKPAPQQRPAGRRVGAVADEGRVFWYAMGASALTSLGTRVFLFFPALILTVPIAMVGAAFGPVATAVMFVGLVGGIAAIDAALAALAGAFVFDSMSRFYEASFIAGFVGQVLGTAVATAAIGVMVGFGLLYIGGVNALVQFVGTQILVGITALSILGLMPVVVLGFFATVVLPAVGGAWAMSVTATPIEGFEIDPTWDPEPLVQRANPRELRRKERQVFAPIRVAIPGT